MEHFFEASNLLNLLTLTCLEIILGVDNVIFIALIVEKLPVEVRNKIRILGLSLALVLRVIMLFGASWIITLKDPLFHLFGFDFTGRNILLFVGGGFLIIKAIMEIKSLFKITSNEKNRNLKDSFFSAVSQIIFIDLILSFDSIITAVGISDNLTTIVIAVVISMIIMLLSSKTIGIFIEQNPGIKVVALCFIGLVGLLLITSGFNMDIPKAYLYFAVFFSVLTETINITLKKRLGK